MSCGPVKLTYEINHHRYTVICAMKFLVQNYSGYALFSNSWGPRASTHLCYNVNLKSVWKEYWPFLRPWSASSGSGGGVGWAEVFFSPVMSPALKSFKKYRSDGSYSPGTCQEAWSQVHCNLVFIKMLPTEKNIQHNCLKNNYFLFLWIRARLIL